MVDPFYEAFDDPAYYPRTTVLRNAKGLRDPDDLDAFEVEMVRLRTEEGPPPGRFGTAHYRSVHHHLFRDVYAWAGRYRDVRMFKGGNSFCFPEYIAREMERLFGCLKGAGFLPGVASDVFVRQVAGFLAELNHIHPFREGNGRTQQVFLKILGQRAGHPLRLEALEAEPFRAAMIESYHDRLAPLVDELERLLS